MSSTALSFVGGIPFTVLYDAVKSAIRKTTKFKANLENLRFTLDCLEPQILQEIGDNHAQLRLPPNVIQDIKAKIEEGTELVNMVLKLSMWNIRIWGNCYNCIGPDWGKQIDDLDKSLRTLIGRLELAIWKIVSDVLIAETSNSDKLDKLNKKVDLLSNDNQKLYDLVMVQNSLIRGAVQSNSVQNVASSSGGGATPAPALGAVFQQLFDIAMQVNVKNMMFKRLLERFKSTLRCLQPLIEEIANNNRILHLPDEEVKHLTEQFKNGEKLFRKCSKVSKRANYRKNEYTTKILSLNNVLQRLFNRLMVQLEKNVKETFDSANKIEAKIKSIEDGGVVQIDDPRDKSHCPVERRSPADVRHVQQFNKQGPRNVIKVPILDSARIYKDQKGLKSDEESDVVKEQMETSEGLDKRLQGSMDVDTLDSTDRIIELVHDSAKTLKGSLEFESQTEISVAPETEPLSPTVWDATKKAGVLKKIECETVTAEPHCSSTSNTKEPEKEEEAAVLVLEHLKSRGNVRKRFKKLFRRISNCGERNHHLSGERKKRNAILWIIPSNCNKRCQALTFCIRNKPSQKPSENREMIMQGPFPEECIGNIISLTTPADACRLSSVSKSFKDAADSDQVWENFLPSPHLIHTIQSQSTSVSTIVPAKSKKEIYFTLCDKPVLIDNGKMSFSLDKWSGKKCYMICARELFIVWADGKSRYWTWIFLAESRFEEVAHLNSVCWLEIRGKIDMSILSPWTLYKAYLVYKLTEDAYGFDAPTEVTLAARHYGFEYGDLAATFAEEHMQIVYLDPNMEIIDGARRPKERADGWLEMELGEFLCQAEEDGELEMVCAEYKDLSWKSGLIVQGLEVRPERKEYFKAKGKARSSYYFQRQRQ